MCSVRRLARMLASPALVHSYPPPPWQDADRRGGDADVLAADVLAGDALADVWLPPADLVLQNGGTGRGRLARLDSLGLVVRIKRPADESAAF